MPRTWFGWPGRRDWSRTRSRSFCAPVEGGSGDEPGRPGRADHEGDPDQSLPAAFWGGVGKDRDRGSLPRPHADAVLASRAVRPDDRGEGGRRGRLPPRGGGRGDLPRRGVPPRPRGHEGDPPVRARGCADDRGAGGGDGGRLRTAAPGLQPVSYTHLTLPTIS